MTKPELEQKLKEHEERIAALEKKVAQLESRTVGDIKFGPLPNNNMFQVGTQQLAPCIGVPMSNMQKPLTGSNNPLGL